MTKLPPGVRYHPPVKSGLLACCLSLTGTAALMFGAVARNARIAVPPGTYFPVLRATSQRDGDAATPYARVQNLARVRVVVKWR